MTLFLLTFFSIYGGMYLYLLLKLLRAFRFSRQTAGLLFYTGAGFPEWQGQVFMGALAGTALWRVALSGNTETAREMIRGPSNSQK